MSRKIVFTEPVDGGEPAVQVKFKGKYQVDYFALRKIAEGDFTMKQTQLARMILSEWVAFYRAAGKVAGEKRRMSEQLVMKFGDDAGKLSARSAGKRGA